MLSGAHSGDVLQVDLHAAFGGTEFGVGPDFPNLQQVGQAFFASDFSSSGVFYFVPEATDESPIPHDTSPARGFQGIVTADVIVDAVPRSLEFLVELGFSETGPNSVSYGNNLEDILRLEQRLRFFGYPEADGNSLDVDGFMDTDTQWAISLFESAHAHTPHDPQVEKVRRDFVNSADAVHWTELTASPGFQILPSVSRGPQPERWATDRAAELMRSAGLSLSQSSSSTLALRSASPAQGGDSGFHTNELNGAHDAGLDLDFETPSTNDSATPFFATREINGQRYIDPGNGDLVFYQPGVGYFAAQENTYSLNDAVRVEISAGSTDPRSAWNNRPVLLGIRPFLRDNLGGGYRVDDVRAQIMALLSAAPSGGAHVEVIHYNDPRTWTADRNFNWDGDGLSGPVQFRSNLSGIFHAEVAPSVHDMTLSQVHVDEIVAGLDGHDDLFTHGGLSTPLPSIGESFSQMNVSSANEPVFQNMTSTYYSLARLVTRRVGI